MDMYNRIDGLLKEKKMSRRQLAEKIEIPASTLASSFNRKSKSISVETVKKIAIALDVTIDYLLDITDAQEIINNTNQDIPILERVDKFNKIIEESIEKELTSPSGMKILVKDGSLVVDESLPDDMKEELVNYYQYLLNKYKIKEDDIEN